jgi:hypothetical protein
MPRIRLLHIGVAPHVRLGPAPLISSTTLSSGASAIPFAGYFHVTASSSPIFAYAHGIAEADGQFFIGLSDVSGNSFPSNQILIFTHPDDLSRVIILHLPRAGGIETMTYDRIRDKVYFALSDNGGLELYSIDPHIYTVSTIISTTTIDTGRRPAIVSDGTYIYGITETDPSTVFKVRISDGALTASSRGHVSLGHSAAIAIYGSSTELYFGGSMSDRFEKVRASDLAVLSSIVVDPCLISNDMPYSNIDDQGGYVYLACEEAPYGIRVRTSDMSMDRFPLPGQSLGLFIWGSDLYNAAQDGAIDVFPGLDIKAIQRYGITNVQGSFNVLGQTVEPNELFLSGVTHNLYFTAWWGVNGLYRVSSTSASHS